MKKNVYSQCLETLFSLRRFGIKLGLDIIGGILSGLGNPHLRYKSIHVAGTNGKGSIASGLSSILETAGFKVGLYTSPHLVRFNERICVNNRPISDEAVVTAYDSVKKYISGDREPTFFEFGTAMAFFEFARQQVDWAVIETGMGGRLDATNVITPEISVISNIALEHQEYLGETIEAIAHEKGGIIKPGIPVVTGASQPEAVQVLKSLAREKGAPFYRLGDDFRVIPTADNSFIYEGVTDRWPSMRTGLSGKYQLSNSAITLAVCELIRKTESGLNMDAIRQGLLRNRWPGRLEIVSTAPLVILDGAHNLAAAERLAEYLEENLTGRNITLVIGILDDKPYAEMLKSLLPFCAKAIVTRPAIHRSLPTDILYDAAREILPDVTVIPSVDQAVKHAMETASDTDAVCIAGSLYVVGEAKAHLETRGIPSFRRAASEN